MPEAQDGVLTNEALKTPKAAAIAGIVFSVLLMVVIWLFRRTVPADPLDPSAWSTDDIASASIALNIVPFAGIAFLWFIGVLRDHLGRKEDRFFATVFFGSALLFLAMFFAAAAMIGAIIAVQASSHVEDVVNSNTLRVSRVVAYVIMNVYALKMAAVFMVSTCTVIVYTRIAPRWMAVAGYVLAVVILLGSAYVGWCVILFPIWVLLLSTHILVVNLRRPAIDIS